jgi:hypothetical protein
MSGVLNLSACLPRSGSTFDQAALMRAAWTTLWRRLVQRAPAAPLKSTLKEPPDRAPTLRTSDANACLLSKAARRLIPTRGKPLVGSTQVERPFVGMNID